MQLRKSHSWNLPRMITAAARAPGRVSVSLWYKLYGWADDGAVTPLPDDQMEGITPREPSFKEISFTFSLIALAAQVARADGPLTAEKYVAFREAFPLRGGICGKIRSLFAMACANPVPYSHYVTQVKYAYPRNTALFTSLVERLFSIAAADGRISPAEEMMLARIAHMLDLSAAHYTTIRDRYLGPPQAHQVLGVGKRPKADQLKQRYRELMRRYHPDRFVEQGLSPEVEMLLRLKTSEIHDAYKTLSKKAA